MVEYAEGELGAVATPLPSKYDQVLGLAQLALPEKYIENGLFNLAFAWHLSHYTDISHPGGHEDEIQEFVRSHLEGMPEQKYNELCEELQRLASLRERAEDGHEREVIEAISEQTGRNHRKLISALRELKPEMAKAAYFRLHGESDRVAA